MELKPCPFCGGKAEVAQHEHYDDPYSDDCSDICCYTKDCHLEFGADFHFEKNEVDKLIDKWNHRPSPWIKVEDALPEKDGKYFTIVSCPWLGAFPDISTFHKKQKRNNGWMPQGDVTHWMPIPPVEGE